MAGYSPNRNIRTPDDNEILFRYLDFYKFVYLVTKKELFFAKASKFEDPMECYYPRAYYAQGAPFNRIFQRKGALENFNDNDIARIKARVEESKTIKEKIGVVSFCTKDYEYEALWKLYSSTKTGLCVVSKVGNLKKSLLKTTYTGSIFIGKVTYRDYENEFVGTSNKFGPIFTKRKEYESENEVRAILVNNSKHDITETECGFAVPIETNLFIEQVILSPNSDDNFEKLVVNLLDTNGFENPKQLVRRSELYTDIER